MKVSEALPDAGSTPAASTKDALVKKHLSWISE